MKRLIAISGPSGSGKTTLAEKLIAAFVADGLRVGAVKHDPHDHAELDRPGKDTWRFREAGAAVVQIAGSKSDAVFMSSRSPETESARPRLQNQLLGCDIVVAEGYRQGPLRRIEFVATGLSPALEPGTIALATEGPLIAKLPVFNRDDVQAIKTFIWSFLQGLATPVAVLAGGLSRRMGVDKATLSLGDGSTPLQRAISSGQEGAFEVAVVSRWPDRHREPALKAGARFLLDGGEDVHPGTGIATALSAHATADGILAMPCDIPGLRPGILRHLDNVAEESSAAFVAFAVGGRIHPLPGFYGQPALEALQAVAREGRPLYDLARAVETRVLGEAVALALDPTLRSFQSLNTPADVADFMSRSPPEHSDRW